MTRKHYNYQTEDELPSQQVRGKPRPPSRSKIRELARRSNEGGRGCCHYCHVYYSMTYLRMKKVGLFQEELVCKDCAKERGL